MALLVYKLVEEEERGKRNEEKKERNWQLTTAATSVAVG
jgi:hypothetical protein